MYENINLTRHLTLLYFTLLYFFSVPTVIICLEFVNTSPHIRMYYIMYVFIFVRVWSLVFYIKGVTETVFENRLRKRIFVSKRVENYIMRFIIFTPRLI